MRVTRWRARHRLKALGSDITRCLHGGRFLLVIATAVAVCCGVVSCEGGARLAASSGARRAGVRSIRQELLVGLDDFGGVFLNVLRRLPGGRRVPHPLHFILSASVSGSSVAPDRLQGVPLGARGRRRVGLVGIIGFVAIVCLSTTPFPHWGSWSSVGVG